MTEPAELDDDEWFVDPDETDPEVQAALRGEPWPPEDGS